MNDQQCDFPRCKNYHSITLIGKQICQTHWEQICCISDNKAENKLLKKIGLIRNDNGSVVSTNKKDQI